MNPLKIIGINIYLEKRVTRYFVGILQRERNEFIFSYDENYFIADNVIPLGPEFPLTERTFHSKKLFPSFEDRIPSRQNPAYPEYCQAMGIEPSEKDPLVLLSTIGSRGPSSFVFYPLFERQATLENLVDFRNSLGFSTREFAKVFEISQSILNAIERKRGSGKDILKRLELILNFPYVALFYLKVNGGILNDEKRLYALQYLNSLEAIEHPLRATL